MEKRYDTLTDGIKVFARIQKVLNAIEQDITPDDCIATIEREGYTTKVYDIVGASVLISKGFFGRNASVKFDDGRSVWAWDNSDEEHPYCSIIFERG